MYTYSDVVEIGRAQDVIMAKKITNVGDDTETNSALSQDEFDE